MNPDVKIVFDAITNKLPAYNTLDAYYRGNQPVPYLTDRLREIFRSVNVAFSANWCAVVINSTEDRINMTGFESSVEPIEAALGAAWERNILQNEASDIHGDALVFGEAFAVVWPGDDGLAEVYYNDPRMIHIAYMADNPRKVRMAGKMWTGEDGFAKMTLYYSDRLEYYTSTTKAESVSNSTAFIEDTPDPHPSGQAENKYNRVPVFHFKTNRYCMSDLTNVIPLQNGDNKLMADMMVAAEFGAYQQRWVISQGDTTGVKNAPGEVLDLPAGDGIGQDTSVGTFQATDLKNYLDAMDRIAVRIGVISNTPKHFFFNSGGDPSGEALIALEAPLNKKAQDRIDRFYPVWQQIGIFICQIEGIAATGADVSPQFDKPETVQPKTEAEIIKLSVDAGIPLDTALSVAGWTDGEIETMNEIKDEDASKAQAGLAGALLDAERRMKTQPMPGASMDNDADDNDQDDNA